MVKKRKVVPLFPYFPFGGRLEVRPEPKDTKDQIAEMKREAKRLEEAFYAIDKKTDHDVIR